MMSSGREHGFEALEEVIASSRIAAVLLSAAGVIRRSADRSSIVAMLRGSLARFRTLNVERRLRLIGVFLAAFAGGHAVLLSLMPVRSAPAIPAATWLLAVLVGVVLFAGANAFAVAWSHRS